MCDKDGALIFLGVVAIGVKSCILAALGRMDVVTRNLSIKNSHHITYMLPLFVSLVIQSGFLDENLAVCV
jgi:hypothetical protein